MHPRNQRQALISIVSVPLLGGARVGFRVPIHDLESSRLSMNLGFVGQTFLSAGLGDFPVARSTNTGQECPVNRQAGKPALRSGSWSQCMVEGASMNRPTPDPSQEGSTRSSASC